MKNEQMKNDSDWFISRLVIAEERNSKCENIPPEVSLTELHRELNVKNNPEHPKIISWLQKIYVFEILKGKERGNGEEILQVIMCMDSTKIMTT